MSISGAAAEVPLSHARQANWVPLFAKFITCPALLARFHVVPPSLVISKSTEVPVGSHVAANPNFSWFTGLFSVLMLDVIVALFEEGFPIQFAAPSPVFRIFRVVELGQ